MVRKLMLVHPDGPATILDEVNAHDEAQLQERIKTNPELLPIDELGLTGPLMVVGRETTLPSGAIDLAVIAPRGDLLLIEFKTGPQNPDFRHALAQLVDYGSDLWSMDLETFESTVARRYFDSDRCPPDAPERRAPSLAAAAERRWADVDTGVMLDRLRSNLERGALLYIVVAQRFTEAMLQTIAYLNEVTRGPTFHAIELVRFQTSDGSARSKRSRHAR